MTYTALVSSQVLSEHIGDPSWVIVDCRFSLKDTQKGYNDYLAGHISGARYAHLDNDLSGEIISRYNWDVTPSQIPNLL